MTPFPNTGATLAHTPASEEHGKTTTKEGSSLTLLVSTLETKLFCGQTKELTIWEKGYSNS